MYKLTAQLITQRNLDPRLQNVVVVATMEEPQHHAHHFYLFFPLPGPTHPLRITDGIIAGTGRTPQQLGAWKVLLIEPNWPCRERLETLIHILQGAGRLNDVQKILTEGGFCGVLFKQDRDTLDQPQHIHRENFRKLALVSSNVPDVDRTFGGHLRGDLASVTRKALLAVMDGLPAGLIASIDLNGRMDRFVEHALGELESIIKQRWHLIEPAQIITFIEATMEGAWEALRTGQTRDGCYVNVPDKFAPAAKLMAGAGYIHHAQHIWQRHNSYSSQIQWCSANSQLLKPLERAEE